MVMVRNSYLLYGTHAGGAIHVLEIQRLKDKIISGIKKANLSKR